MTVLRSVTSGGAAGAPNSVLDYSEEVNVPSGVLTTLSTVVSAGTSRVAIVTLSGSMYAKFFCILDTQVIAVKRSGPHRNVDFVFNIQLNNGQIFETKVQHFTGVGDALFESLILGF